jgi:hypothetical protein
VRKAFIGMVLFTTAMVFGCGSPPPAEPLNMGGEDGSAIATIIEDFNDAITSQKKLSALFASGAKQPEMSKLTGLSFSIVGKPTVTGGSAKAQVLIEKAGQKVAEATWSFEKAGDKWKIKEAPLS